MEGKQIKNEFDDETIACCDCGQPLTFSAGEQKFFWSKGLSKPRRCPDCRLFRKRTLIPAGELGDWEVEDGE